MCIRPDPTIKLGQGSFTKELNRNITPDIQMKAAVSQLKVNHIFPAEEELFLRVFTNGSIMVNMR